MMQVEIVGNPAFDQMTTLMNDAFNRAQSDYHKLSARVLNMRGMSGRRYRMFINNLVGYLEDARYLEVGSWAGSTVCAAIEGNVISATCIDNWSEFGGPREEFLINVRSTLSTTCNTFRLLEEDFRSVDVENIGKFNIYMFDGPHEEQDQFDGFSLFQHAFDDHLFYIVDDWNWDRVRSGTLAAIEQSKFNVDYSIQVRTSLDGVHAEPRGEQSEWHNGYFLCKMSRRSA